MTGHQLFDIPVIQQDLRHEETIVQIADALTYLNNVLEDVFNRLESRIARNTSSLDRLRARARVTAAQVDKLKGSNKATKIFSSAKYPAGDAHKDYKSSFIPNTALPCLNHSSKKITSHHLPTEGQVLQEKLQFYHVKVSRKLLRRNIEIAPEEGLGSLPRDVDSISSLLLFNTSENPYKRYVMFDPLGAITKTRETLDQDQQMCAAPISISHQEKMARQEQGESYFYSPGLGDVPLIDVPLDLPYLPGIADDLCYSTDIAETMIAPSVATTPANTEHSNIATTIIPPTIPALPTIPILPSMPILPTIPVLPALPVVPGVPTSKLPAPSPPAPPPPPPPVNLPPLPPTPSQQVLPDARTNLMEAIRKAGGSGKARLKAIDEQKAKENTRKEEGEGARDLMADLHAKLAMRRKGISGAAMDRIKDMIPPPAPNSNSNTEEETEGDWE